MTLPESIARAAELPTLTEALPAARRLRLLHVISSIDPAGGGPSEAVLQSALRCVAEGHRVEVLSLDDPAAAFVAAYPLPVHALGPARGYYKYTAALVPWLRAHASGFDAVIVNGLWQYHGLGTWRALRAAGVPYFVFTHGMLDPWFKRTYPLKHLRKWLVWPWAEYRLLRDARAVLFTCEEERLLARRSFWLYKAREAVVAFGTRRPPADGERLREKFFEAFPSLEGQRLLLFLGRLHPKKGCDLLVKAFAHVAAVDPTLRLVMAGPDANDWRKALQAEAAQQGLADRIVWPGMLQGDLKWGAFFACEAFVLPSHQENFGIAVAEALGCGRPVLISDKVNIWREIAASGAGFVAPDTLAGTEECLCRWLALKPAERARMGSLARACFDRHFTIEAMAGSLLDLVARETRPLTVQPA